MTRENTMSSNFCGDEKEKPPLENQVVVIVSEELTKKRNASTDHFVALMIF